VDGPGRADAGAVSVKFVVWVRREHFIRWLGHRGVVESEHHPADTAHLALDGRDWDGTRAHAPRCNIERL